MPSPLSLGFGCTSMTAPLRRVLVHSPRPHALASWEACGWHGRPDPAKLAAEHEAFCEQLAGTGADVVRADAAAASNADAIYVFDDALVGAGGAYLLRPGKEGRRGEPDALRPQLERAGVPVTGALEPPALAEGGDLLRLDERTLVAGRGYRTNDAGIEALAAAFPELEVIAFDLPHWHGRGEVMHLLSLLSPVAEDLVLAYRPLLPVRLAELLDERGLEVVDVPHDEFESMGANVLALAPRVVLALDGNRETRRRLERAGVEVLVYSGDEISRKGDGGPTCLTLPLLRAG